jgi:hypothetical protein
MRVKTMKLKTLKRNDFHILYEAQHPEPGERFIVFRSLDEEEKVWVLPKEEFLQDSIKLIKHKSQQDRLAQNSEDVFFPNISYSDKIPPLVDDDVFSTSVKSMITLLVRKGLVTKGVFAELRTDDDIESLILEKVKNYSCGDNIEEIFHLIQIWGGITGRGVYIFNKLFDWNRIAPFYQKLVDRCISTKELNKKSIEKLVITAKEFDESVKYIGVSFITKHMRFWMYYSLGNDALPIYDRIMASCVMRKNSVQIKHLSNYWDAMILKSRQLNISLMALERQIFKYAYIDN